MRLSQYAEEPSRRQPGCRKHIQSSCPERHCRVIVTAKRRAYIIELLFQNERTSDDTSMLKVYWKLVMV